MNESFWEEFFTNEVPVGHSLLAQGDNMRIVGVFADTYYGDIRRGATPMVLVASPEQLWRARTFVVRTAGPPEMLVPMCAGFSATFGRTSPSSD